MGVGIVQFVVAEEVGAFAQADGDGGVVMAMDNQCGAECVGLSGKAALVFVLENGLHGQSAGVLEEMALRLVYFVVGVGVLQGGAVAEVPKQAVEGMLVFGFEDDGVVHAPYRVGIKRVGRQSVY